MKKNIVKRLLALSLSTMMLLSLAACGEQEEKKEVSESKQESKEEVKEESKEEVSSEVEEGTEINVEDLEPITLTMSITWSDYGAGIHTEENAWLQALYDATHVELDFMMINEESITVMAADGSFPDMGFVFGVNANTAIDSGAFVPLDDLLAEYGQDIVAAIPDGIESCRRPDGNVYTLPSHVVAGSTVPQTNGWIGFRARYDIYEAIGAPEIKTEDDWLEVLKQMVEYERERTGEDDIYALSDYVDWGLWQYTNCYPRNQGLYAEGSYNVDKTTLECLPAFIDTDSAYWDGIRFFNKAYRMGIFDVDGMTQNNSQYVDKVANGKLLATSYNGSPDPAICGEDAIMTYLPGTAFPHLAGTYAEPTPIGYCTEASRFISVNCEYPERAMMVWNWIDSYESAMIMRNGIQGEDWDYDENGEAYMMDAMKEAIASGNSANYRLHRTGDTLCYTNIYAGVSMCPDGVVRDVYLANNETAKEEAANAQQINFAKKFGDDLYYPGQVYQKWIEESNGALQDDVDGVYAIILSMVDFSPYNAMPELKDAINLANDYVKTNISKFILAETEEEFEEQIQAFDDYCDELNVDASFAKIKECWDKAVADYKARQ